MLTHVSLILSPKGDSRRSCLVGTCNSSLNQAVGFGMEDDDQLLIVDLLFQVPSFSYISFVGFPRVFL